MCAALVAVAVLLGSCAGDPRTRPAPRVGPWGYEFELGDFRDERPDDDAKLMASPPFTVNAFMVGWRNSVGRVIWGNEKAKLDLTLHQYETSSSGSSYSISMDVSLRGRDMYGRTIGTPMNGRCSAIERIDVGTWGDFWQQARDEGTNDPLTPKGRNATMWQKVMDSCVTELAKQFDTSMAAGPR